MFNLNKKKIFDLMLGGLFIFSTPSFSLETKKPEEKAAMELIQRVIPSHSDKFEVALIAKEDDKDLFEIESVSGKIILRGNNGIAIASALNYYLKNYAHCQITWNGTNLNLPDPLPIVPEKIQKRSPYKYRYYLNYCTFNYSMSWWDWDRWQKEIDWMALNGINMPLAVTGQNSIWQRVYKSLGFTDKELECFFSGPAYFNWFWMGNLDGWGGPLPQSFMDQHEALQKKILQRERSFGMTPILPAFTGHVPPTFQNKFPEAKIKKTKWGDFSPVCILDPSEPLFTEIGKRFIEEEIKVYGTDHLYSADTFNENTPPTKDSVFLNDVSRKVYQSMASADPQATWIMQGWMFHHQRNFWGAKEIQALLNAIPNDHMLILDLYSELHPVWNRTKAYYGKPWIWCMLHNFGKNISMSGIMSSISQNPAKALNDPKAGKMMGIGLTPEGIEQNPVLYDLMLENVWRNTPIDLESWLKDYAFCRYGKKNMHAERAWDLLSKSVYADSITSGGPESIITARPTFAKNPGGCTSTKLPYDQMALVKAWEQIMAASDELKNSDGYQYDVVDITRQVLANYASTVQQQVAKDYENNDRKAFIKDSKYFLELITNMDELLSTRSDFLLGNWLNSAKKCGITPEEKHLYERNARNLITTWGDKDNNLHEYACKQWSGMLNGFYKIRWENFFHQVYQDMQQKKKFDQKSFDNASKDWEWNWVDGTESYPDKPKGDAIEMSVKMYEKYHKSVLKTCKD